MLRNCKYQGAVGKSLFECLENESNDKAQRFFKGNGVRIADCQGALVGRVVDVMML